MYPKYNEWKLVDRFFYIYSQWKWKEMPVILENIVDYPENEKINME